MNPRWFVSVPVWGERCLNVFCATALPALEQAILELRKRTTAEVVLVAHTDDPSRIRGAATEIDIETRKLPAGFRDFDCLSQSHREVLSMALKNDRVVLLTADLVVSTLALVRCAEILENPQKQLVVCASVRTLEEGRIPDSTKAQKLMRWAWKNQHPMTTAATYPEGTINDMSRLYFQEEDTVIARCCLPHPLAVRITGRPLPFTPTIDANLIQNFVESEIHVEEDTDKLALIELSPASKAFNASERSLEDRLAHKNNRRMVSDPMQRALLSYRIVLQGTRRNAVDQEVIDKGVLAE